MVHFYAIWELCHLGSYQTKYANLLRIVLTNLSDYVLNF